MLQLWLRLVKKWGWPAFAFAPFGNVQVRSGPGGFSCRSKRDHETPAETTSRPLNPLALSPAVVKNWGRRREVVLRWTGKKRGIWGDVCGMKKIRRQQSCSFFPLTPTKKAGKGPMSLCRVLRSGWGIERNRRKNSVGFAGNGGWRG